MLAKGATGGSCDLVTGIIKDYFTSTIEVILKDMDRNNKYQTETGSGCLQSSLGYFCPFDMSQSVLLSIFTVHKGHHIFIFYMNRSTTSHTVATGEEYFFFWGGGGA